MILKLLFTLDFWFVIIDIKNKKHFKKDKYTTKVFSIASNKMMGLVHSRRWEKRNRVLMKSSMNLSEFSNVEFLVKYK